MSARPRRLPVRPDLTQVKHQAKDLLKLIRAGDAEALELLREFHPDPPDPAVTRLADAQLALARCYGASSWPRLVQSCELVDAIWEDDPGTIRRLVVANPNLLHEDAGIGNTNWGPPLSYAANVGRDRIIQLLYEMGARDLRHAIDRAILQSRVGTARMLYDLLGRPRLPGDAFGSPAYTLSASGTALLFELGAELPVQDGKRTAPVDVVLESDSRRPEAVHQILAMYAEHGFDFPDTAPMAVFRGRLDLLERQAQRDPGLLTRTFRYEELFPPELGCGAESLPRTTLHGATLLHLCVEFEELETARWLLDRGMSPAAWAAVDGGGFGGHTALFGAVVGYPNFWMNFTGGWSRPKDPKGEPFARLLLERGADPNARASMRERIGYGGEEYRLHRDITPLRWGGVFHNRLIVSEAAMSVVRKFGGTEAGATPPA